MNSSTSSPAAGMRSDTGRRLAYLLSAYPAISHTFFLNEIAELRKLGFSIDVASINKPNWTPDTLSGPVANALETTYYVKGRSPALLVLVLLKVMLARPLVVLRGIRAALKLGGSGPQAALYALFYLAEALILGDWLRRKGHTHLHVHFGGPVASVGMLASLAWRIPYSIAIHGPEEFYSVDKTRLRQKVEHAKFVICISDHCRAQLMRLSDPGQWKKFQVARLGVDPKLFAPAPGLGNDGALEIISVGRLVPDKGQLILLQAFSELLSRGHRLRLRLVGDGADRPRIEAFIRDRELGRSVFLEGALNHDATRKLLAQADIFVLSSFAEGLPVALMEAMAMELPCVSTFIAGIPELIRPEVDGLLVPASSHEALAGALARLIDDAELRRALARSGRRRVLQLYDLATNVGLLAETFRNQLDNPGARPAAEYELAPPMLAQPKAKTLEEQAL